jgi:hypothetical protein
VIGFIGTSIANSFGPSDEQVLAEKLSRMTPTELAKYNEDVKRQEVARKNKEAEAASLKRIAYENSPQGRREKAMEALKLESFEWERKGFGTVLQLIVRLQNDGNRPVKDIVFKCLGAAKSGTVIDSNTRTLYDIVRANTSSAYAYDLSMGFISSQVEQISCRIIDLTVM